LPATDLFEVVLLVGACFLVNYVTADAKTNWAEGWVLLSFYLMIVSFPHYFYAPAYVLKEKKTM
jgi:Ca2+:H+ antiporter